MKLWNSADGIVCWRGGMFVNVTTSSPRRYVQLVESYRDDAGRVKKRTVATLGRLDQVSSELDSVINGLLKVAGRTPSATEREWPKSGGIFSKVAAWRSHFEGRTS